MQKWRKQWTCFFVSWRAWGKSASRVLNTLLEVTFRWFEKPAMSLLQPFKPAMSQLQPFLWTCVFCLMLTFCGLHAFQKPPALCKNLTCTASICALRKMFIFCVAAASLRYMLFTFASRTQASTTPTDASVQNGVGGRGAALLNPPPPKGAWRVLNFLH